MKFYIASKLGNYGQVRKLSGILKSAGWVHTYDWTADWIQHSSTKAVDCKTLEAIALNEYNGVKEADVVIVLTPEGRGTHTEFGMAIALNKKVYICHIDDTYFKCDDNTSSFYWLPQINQLIGTTEDIAKKLLDLSE